MHSGIYADRILRHKRYLSDSSFDTKFSARKSQVEGLRDEHDDGQGKDFLMAQAQAYENKMKEIG